MEVVFIEDWSSVSGSFCMDYKEKVFIIIGLKRGVGCLQGSFSSVVTYYSVSYFVLATKTCFIDSHRECLIDSYRECLIDSYRECLIDSYRECF